MTPDADEARELLKQELADPRYDAAEPTFFDRAAQAVAEFIGRLFSSTGDGDGGAVLAIVALVVFFGLLIAAILVWGRPRVTIRSRRPGALFGEDDGRTAEQLRADAESAAAQGDWEAAIALRVRAIARALQERTIVELEPGATVHRFARQAAVAFPAATADLDVAADAFDDVRYLHRPGTEAIYRRVARLDAELDAARPQLVTV